ncbi:MAG: HD domain-containing protein [Firmicutes bacterium]|nr:HD domain-containing protein [Bacillota bacterium]
MIHEAIEFAAIMHDGQKRKGTNTPYIVHPMEVMYYLVLEGADKDTVTAGILHDVVEDTPVTIDEIESRFGRPVAELVGYETEDKSKIWAERKKETILRLKDAPEGAMLICAADKLCNLKSIYSDMKTDEDVWARFTGDRARSRWYYSGIIDALEPLKERFVYTRLVYYFEQVFGTSLS